MMTTPEETLDALTPAQQTVICDLFEAERNGDLPIVEGGLNVGLDLLLAVTGDRPGVLLYNGYLEFEEVQSGLLYTAIDTLDLPRLAIFEARQFYPDDVPVPFELPEGTRYIDDAPEYRRSGTLVYEMYYVSRDPDRLQDFNHEDGREFAEFLGYPTPSIEAFLDTESDYSVSLADYAATLTGEDAVPPEDLRYTSLVPYVVRRHPDSIREAVARGKQYYAVCEAFDAATGESLATEFADARLESFNAE